MHLGEKAHKKIAAFSLPRMFLFVPEKAKTNTMKHNNARGRAFSARYNESLQYIMAKLTRFSPDIFLIFSCARTPLRAARVHTETNSDRSSAGLHQRLEEYLRGARGPTSAAGRRRSSC